MATLTLRMSDEKYLRLLVLSENAAPPSTACWTR
jgi:hypothetical protein